MLDENTGKTNDAMAKDFLKTLLVVFGLGFQNIATVCCVLSGKGLVPPEEMGDNLSNYLKWIGSGAVEAHQIASRAKVPNTAMAIVCAIADYHLKLAPGDCVLDKKYKKMMEEIGEAAYAELNGDKNKSVLACANILHETKPFTKKMLQGLFSGEAWKWTGESKAYSTIKKGSEDFYEQIQQQYQGEFAVAFANAGLFLSVSSKGIS